jgi:hypothetical protein
MPYICVRQKFSECGAANRIPYFYGTSDFLTVFARTRRSILYEAPFPRAVFSSAAVKVMELLTLRIPATGSGFCAALLGGDHWWWGTAVPLVETAVRVFSFWKRSLNLCSYHLEQLIVVQPLKKVFAFFVTRRFSTVTTRTRLCSRF